MQGALMYFHALRPAGRMANSVPDRVLNDLLSKLSEASMPAELLRTLMLMKSDFMRLPPVDTDDTGRSFLTLWLVNRHLSAPPSAPSSGFEGGLGTPIGMLQGLCLANPPLLAVHTNNCIIC